jgi:hypothetical protein
MWCAEPGAALKWLAAPPSSARERPDDVQQIRMTSAMFRLFAQPEPNRGQPTALGWTRSDLSTLHVLVRRIAPYGKLSSPTAR